MNFRDALLLSLGFHFFLLRIGNISFRFHEKPVVEIDITNMGHTTVKRSIQETSPVPSKPMASTEKWVKPAPDQKVVPAPVSTPETPPVPAVETSTQNVSEEYSIGTGDNDQSALSRIPQLLNLSDVGAILNRFYPEEARVQRREATVVLDLHIDVDGHIKSVDIVESGDADFDEAARRVAKLLRFTPAFIGNQSVAVKLRQAIQFKLRNS